MKKTQIQKHLPPARLSHWVREMYYCEFVGEEVIPVMDDGCYDLVLFREKDASLVFGEAQISIPITTDVFTIHNLTPPYRIVPKNTLSFFTIKFQPWYNAIIFPGLSQPGLYGLPRDWVVFRERFLSLLEMNLPFEERFKRAISVLDEIQPQLPLASKIITSCCSVIYNTQGNVTVQELSDMVHLSRQSLNRQFKEAVYYSLKTFITIVRINACIRNKLKYPSLSFTQLALDFGYFDQAHFNRDFKRVSGLTPGTFFSELPAFMERHTS